MGYRDIRDCYDGLLLDFVDDVGKFYDCLMKVRSDGGGNLCEDVITGFTRAVNLNWKNHTKILIHIADNPSHGSKYNGGVSDHSPHLQPDFKSKFEKLFDLGVHYHFYKIQNATDHMISEFRKDAPERMVIREENVGDVSTFLKTLKFTTSYSISRVLKKKIRVCSYYKAFSVQKWQWNFLSKTVYVQSQ